MKKVSADLFVCIMSTPMGNAYGTGIVEPKWKISADRRIDLDDNL